LKTVLCGRSGDGVAKYQSADKCWHERGRTP
jgi:hypothetical protein